MTLMHRAQHGFAAIAAIFLLVVLAALGGFMLTFSNTQQLTSAQDLQGSRAYWAARAGLEWGIVSATNSAACSAMTTSTAATPLPIEGFAVKVECQSGSYDDPGTIVVFNINSTASVGTTGSIGAIERSVSASICRKQADGSFC